MDKGYYFILHLSHPLGFSMSQSTIKMDKGYYHTHSLLFKVFNQLSQSTIKMDKGYYINLITGCVNYANRRNPQ